MKKAFMGIVSVLGVAVATAQVGVVDFDGVETGLVGYTNPVVTFSGVGLGTNANEVSSAGLSTYPAGDSFWPMTRAAVGPNGIGMPFNISDDSVAGAAGNTVFATDVLGFAGQTKTDGFFGITDTVNGSGLGDTVVAEFVFDISGATNLSASVDFAYMGDGEAADVITFEYNIDGGAGFLPLFTNSVDESGSQGYVMDSGTSVTLDDPMSVNGVLLGDTFQTISAPITGTGSLLTIRVSATTDGAEGFGFDNLIIDGDTGGNPCPGDINVLVDHLGAVPANAIALYGQGFPSQIFGDFPDFNIAMIDDLTVSGSARSVSWAEYVAFFSDPTTVPGDIAGYQFEVYSSDAAAAASITGDICSVSVAAGAAVATDITAPGNLPTFLYELPITDCSLSPGTYRFAVLTVMDFGPNGQTFSNASDLTVVGTDSNSKQTNPGGGFGIPGNIEDCITDLGPICNAPYRVIAGPIMPTPPTHELMSVDNDNFQAGGSDGYTFRLIVNTSGSPSDDWMSTSLNATLNAPWTFYQDAFGSDPVNPAFFNVFPSVQWDTFFTSPAFYPNTGVGGSQSFADGPTTTPNSLSATWFDTANSGNGDWTVLQVTVLQPAGAPAITLTPTDTVVGTISGTTETKNFTTPLTNYSFTLYQQEAPTLPPTHQLLPVDNGGLQIDGQDAYTFRLITTIDPDDDWLETTASATLSSVSSFYQNALGSDTIDPALIPANPSLEWDSYYSAPLLYPNTADAGNVQFLVGPSNSPQASSATWFDAQNAGGGDFVVAQYTVLQPAGLPPITLEPVGNPVGTLSGATTTSAFPGQTPFAFTLYREPLTCQTNAEMVEIFDLPDLDQSANLILVGDAAAVPPGGVRLTPAVRYQTGAMWYGELVPVTDEWRAVFSFTIDPFSAGGHGLALVIQSVGPDALGGIGFGLGYAGSDVDGIPNSIAIEFDSVSNPALGDPPGPHISVHASALPNEASEAVSLGSVLTDAWLTAQPVTVTLTYSSGVLRVCVNQGLASLEVPLALEDYLLDLDQRAWIGLTSGTGDFVANHDIWSWSYSAAVTCIGDITGDLAVTQLDLNILVAFYGLCEDQPGWFPPANLSEDPGLQCINQEDLSVLLSNFGEDCP